MNKLKAILLTALVPITCAITFMFPVVMAGFAIGVMTSYFLYQIYLAIYTALEKR